MAGIKLPNTVLSLQAQAELSDSFLAHKFSSPSVAFKKLIRNPLREVSPAQHFLPTFQQGAKPYMQFL